jgi:hypothetical protein
MHEQCGICGRRLYFSSEEGYYKTCAVCHIYLCSHCHIHGFCMNPFQALSESGQTLVKWVYRSQYLSFLAYLVIAVIWGTESLPVTNNLQLFFLGVILGGISWVGYIIAVNCWLPRYWRRDTEQKLLRSKTWQCVSCGFKNPTISLNCRQCGRARNAWLRKD